MTPIQEMVLTLFTNETLEKVKKQFSNRKEIVSNESFNMSFRLYYSKAGNINLEVLTQIPIEKGEAVDIPNLGRGQIQSTKMFFKPVGFYTQKKGFLSSSLEITIVKEFEEAYDQLLNSKQLNSVVTTHKLSLEENAVLAAFSMEAYINAEKYQDASFFANGLHCDAIMTFQGYPQIFLDDRYGLRGPIAAYMLREQNSINPIVQYEDLFHKFRQMDLNTAMKGI